MHGCILQGGERGEQTRMNFSGGYQFWAQVTRWVRLFSSHLSTACSSGSLWDINAEWQMPLPDNCLQAAKVDEFKDSQPVCQKESWLDLAALSVLIRLKGARKKGALRLGRYSTGVFNFCEACVCVCFPPQQNNETSCTGGHSQGDEGDNQRVQGFLLQWSKARHPQGLRLRQWRPRWQAPVDLRALGSE